jgi:hypothetical protein
MSGVPGELLQQRMRDDVIELLSHKAGSHLRDTVENLVGEVGAARARLDYVEARGGQRVAHALITTAAASRASATIRHAASRSAI